MNNLSNNGGHRKEIGATPKGHNSIFSFLQKKILWRRSFSLSVITFWWTAPNERSMFGFAACFADLATMVLQGAEALIDGWFNVFVQVFVLYQKWIIIIQIRKTRHGLEVVSFYRFHMFGFSVTVHLFFCWQPFINNRFWLNKWRFSQWHWVSRWPRRRIWPKINWARFRLLQQFRGRSSCP